ncbi:MAG: hypothetical protein R3Y54_12410 [Eubacteriales bacterium]
MNKNNERLRELASILLMSTKTSQMEDIVDDYVEFSKEEDFKMDRREVIQSLSISYWKIGAYFILLSVLYVLPFYVSYVRGYSGVLPESLLYYLNMGIYVVFPIVMTFLFGRKLQIVNRFYHKHKSAQRVTIVLSVLTHMSIIGTLYFIDQVVKFPTEFVEAAQQFWYYWEIMMTIGILGATFVLVKLITCGTSYFLTFFQLQVALFFFIHFGYWCSKMDDVSNFKSMISRIVVEYVVAMMISILCYIRIRKMGGEKDESTI